MAESGSHPNPDTSNGAGRHGLVGFCLELDNESRRRDEAEEDEEVELAEEVGEDVLVMSDTGRGGANGVTPLSNGVTDEDGKCEGPEEDVETEAEEQEMEGDQVEEKEDEDQVEGEEEIKAATTVTENPCFLLMSAGVEKGFIKSREENEGKIDKGEEEAKLETHSRHETTSKDKLLDEDQVTSTTDAETRWEESKQDELEHLVRSGSEITNFVATGLTTDSDQIHVQGDLDTTVTRDVLPPDTTREAAVDQINNTDKDRKWEGMSSAEEKSNTDTRDEDAKEHLEDGVHSSDDVLDVEIIPDAKVKTPEVARVVPVPDIEGRTDETQVGGVNQTNPEEDHQGGGVNQTNPEEDHRGGGVNQTEPEEDHQGERVKQTKTEDHQGGGVNQTEPEEDHQGGDNALTVMDEAEDMRDNVILERTDQDKCQETSAPQKTETFQVVPVYHPVPQPEDRPLFGQQDMDLEQVEEALELEEGDAVEPDQVRTEDPTNGSDCHKPQPLELGWTPVEEELQEEPAKEVEDEMAEEPVTVLDDDVEEIEEKKSAEEKAGERQEKDEEKVKMGKEKDEKKAEPKEEADKKKKVKENPDDEWAVNRKVKELKDATENGNMSAAESPLRRESWGTRRPQRWKDNDWIKKDPVEDEMVPETKDEEVPETKDEKVPETKDEKVPETKDEKVPETKDEEVPETKDEKVPETKDEKVQETKDEKVPEIKDKKVQEMKEWRKELRPVKKDMMEKQRSRTDEWMKELKSVIKDESSSKHRVKKRVVLLEDGRSYVPQKDEMMEEVQLMKEVQLISHRRTEPPFPPQRNLPSEHQEHKISLYVKAGSDGESIGNCPFSQRLFMILWLKRVVFTVTTVDMKRKPSELQDLAPGINPPFVTFNGEVKVDVNMIEEFLEDQLTPPCFPRLAPKHGHVNTAGIDVFAKFSAYIKNPRKDADQVLENALVKSLQRLDDFLRTPLPEEIDTDKFGDVPESTRSFLDGSDLTLADCNLLPKLHILKVVAKKYRSFQIPAEMTGVWRYLNSAYQREEFTNTCPAQREIEFAYLDVAKRIK